MVRCTVAQERHQVTTRPSLTRSLIAARIAVRLVAQVCVNWSSTNRSPGRNCWCAGYCGSNRIGVCRHRRFNVRLQARLGLSRAVFVQASCHGVDNSAMVDAINRVTVVMPAWP